MTAITCDMTIHYEAGHASHEVWEHLPDFHCPSCSALTIWRDCNEGDYYVGEPYLCLTCERGFTMQGPTIVQGWQNVQRLAALRQQAKEREA